MSAGAERRPIDVAWAEHYYCCGLCGRWFGADYRDPYTGETLNDHAHGGKQLELFAEASR